jgi:replicative DNA helicase
LVKPRGPLSVAVDALRAELQGRSPAWLPSGYPALDALIGGFRPGSLTILAGPPYTGKTTLAANILHRLACGQGAPVGVVSHCRRERLVGLLAAVDADLPHRQLRLNRLSRAGRQLVLRNTLPRLAEASIFIDDARAGALRARVRQLAVKHGARLIVVDKLEQFIEGQAQAQAAPALCRELRGVAEETGAAILLLVDVDATMPKRSDLMAYGPIAREADSVALLLAPGTLEDPPDVKAPWILRVAPGRTGVCGDVHLRRSKSRSRFD